MKKLKPWQITAPIENHCCKAMEDCGSISISKRHIDGQDRWMLEQTQNNGRINANEITFCPYCGIYLNRRTEPENRADMSPKHKAALAELVKMMDEDENGLTVEELSNAYLNICDSPCDGDQTTGIAPCKFWVMPDVDDNYNPTKGYCKLEAYRRKPKGSENNE